MRSMSLSYVASAFATSSSKRSMLQRGSPLHAPHHLMSMEHVHRRVVVLFSKSMPREGRFPPPPPAALPAPALPPRPSPPATAACAAG
jgi:hypothetical protein